MAKLVFDDKHYFGHCPVPEHMNRHLNIGRGHWMVCDECRLKWLVGSNLFSSWREEDEKTWRGNSKRIGKYKEVKV